MDREKIKITIQSVKNNLCEDELEMFKYLLDVETYIYKLEIEKDKYKTSAIEMAKEIINRKIPCDCPLLGDINMHGYSENFRKLHYEKCLMRKAEQLLKGE